MHLSPPPLVAYAAVRSKAVVLLLLIYCFMYLPLFVGVCVCLCFGMHYFMSFLVLQEETAGCFDFIGFWMSYYCKCHAALPHGAVVWSAVCDCGIS